MGMSADKKAQQQEREERRKKKRAKRQELILMTDAIMNNMNQQNSTRHRDPENLQRTRDAVEHLASLYEYIHRVASFANLFRENRDLLDKIETNESIKRGLKREEYIQSLRAELEAVERLKNFEIDKKEKNIKELENKVRVLTAEKASLEAGRKKLEEERAKFEKEKKDEKARMDKERKEELVRRLNERAKEKKDQEEKLKAKEAFLEQKANEKIAAHEAETNKKLDEMRQQKATALEEKEGFKKELEDAREEIKKQKIFHDLLLKENKRLKSELEKAELRCPIQTEKPEVYKEELEKLFQQIRKFTTNYFTYPPPGDIAKHFRLSRKLVKCDPIFEQVPILPTPASTFLRQRVAQHFVIECLKKEIWRPFRSASLERKAGSASSVLQAMSATYQGVNPEDEAAWRVLTYKGLDAIATSSETGDGQDIVQASVKTIARFLSPLILDSSQQDFRRDLTDILEVATSIWNRLRSYSGKVLIDFSPGSNSNSNNNNQGPDGVDGWEPERCGQEVDLPKDLSEIIKDAVPESFDPWCLFPRVEARSMSGDLYVLHRGRALFPDSPAFAKVRLEQDEMLLHSAVPAPATPTSICSYVAS